MPWLRRLVAGLSPRKPGLDPGLVHVRFVVDKVTLGHVFLRLLRFSPVSIIPPLLRTHLHIQFAVIRRTNGRILGAFRKAVIFGNRGTLDRKEISLFSLHSWLLTLLLTLLLTSRPSPRHASAPSGTHPPPVGPFPLPNPVHVPF